MANAAAARRADRQRAGRRESADRIGRPLEARAALPTPEAVFVAWLLWLPAGVDLQAAARREIARIDACRAQTADLRRLRSLLTALSLAA